MESTCIAVPIKKGGLSASMITRTGQSVAINWDEGKAWEVLQDVKPAGGGHNRRDFATLASRVIGLA